MEFRGALFVFGGGGGLPAGGEGENKDARPLDGGVCQRDARVEKGSGYIIIIKIKNPN